MEGNFGSGKIWRIHCVNILAEENLANYRMEGNFGSRKIWRIHYVNILAEKNLANYEILQVKISRKTYSIKHSEHLRHAKICDITHAVTPCSAVRLPT